MIFALGTYGVTFEQSLLDSLSSSTGETNNVLVFRSVAYVLALILTMTQLSHFLRLLSHFPTTILLGGLIIASYFWSMFPNKVLINTLHYLGLLLCVNCFVMHFAGRPSMAIRWIANCATVLVMIAVASCLLIPNIAISANDGAWMGLTGNRNSLGFLCAVCVWACVGELVANTGGRRKFVYWIGIALASYALLKTGSKTSLLIYTIILSLYLLLFFVRAKSATVAIVVLTLSAFAVSLFTLFLVMVGNVSVPGVSDLLALMGKEETLSGRTRLWSLAVELYLQKPFLGWGFDSNLSATGATTAVINAGQFHNGYLGLLVKGGITAILLLVGITYSLGQRLFQLWSVAQRDITPYGVLFIAIYAHNLSESSFVRLTHILWMLLLFTYVYVNRTNFVGTQRP